MEVINMHCKSISQIQSDAYSGLKVGRAYREEVLIQVWLQSNKK